MPHRLLALILVALLVGSAAGGDDRRRVGPRGRPWLGLESEDLLAEGAADLKRLNALQGMGPLLVRSAPIAWDAIVPLAPLEGGRQLHDWAALDRGVVGWQHRGARLVLVLEPRAVWAAEAEGPAAFERDLAVALGRDVKALAREIGSGVRAPQDWTAWQRFVRDVVERYDKDGTDDAEGLLHPVRWIQILDVASRPSTWIGSASEYARLLHHAQLGAREASSEVRVAHGGVDLDTLARVDAPRLSALPTALARHVRDRTDLDRFLARRELEFAEASLGLSRVYQAAAVSGADRLEWELRGLELLDAFLEQGKRGSAERWLTRTPAAKLEGGTTLQERRVRARWAAAARGRSKDRGRARRWLDEGRAYDAIRTIVAALLSGADRVFLGHAVEGGDDGSLDVFVEKGEEGGWWRRAPWYALRQALRHVDRPAWIEELEVAGKCRGVRIGRESATIVPWVVILLPDPDRTWAGNPREESEPTKVALQLAAGRYRVEQIAVGPEDPVTTEHDLSDGVLRLSLGPAPVYVVPVIRGATSR